MVRVRVLVASLAVGSVATYDMGPTYGKDYSGMDYNVTVWNSG
jgi:hypothetical protein